MYSAVGEYSLTNNLATTEAIEFGLRRISVYSAVDLAAVAIYGAPSLDDTFRPVFIGGSAAVSDFDVGLTVLSGELIGIPYLKFVTTNNGTVKVIVTDG